MKKKTLRKIATALLMGASVAAIGFGVGCNCGDKGGNKKHNWDWDYDQTGHWQYCTDDGCDEKTEKVPHVDANSDGYCDVEECHYKLPAAHTHDYSQWVNTDADEHWKVCPADNEIDEATRAPHDFTNGNCECGKPNPNYVKATIHFHKPADFGDKVYAHAYYHSDELNKDVDLDAGWCSLEMTDEDGDGWYTIEVNHPKDTGFNFMIVKEDEKTTFASPTITAAETWVNTNGNDFTSKQAAIDDEAADKVEYSVYYYAPDWTDDAVYVYTYGGPSVGEYNTEMTADGEDGWYKLTFETTQEFDAFSIIFHTMDEATKHEFGVTLTEALLEGKAFYFIANDNGVFGSKEEAKAAYDEADVPVTDVKSYTIYVYAPDWEDVSVHIWNAYETGGAFGHVKMTAVDGRKDWYSYTFDCSESAFTEKGVNIIFVDMANDEQDNEVRLTTYTKGEDYVYFNVSEGDKAFTSFDEAVPVHNHTYSDWMTDGDKHWKVATCGDLAEGDEDYIIEEGTHTKGDNEKCTTCGYDMHEHTYDEEHWTQTSTQHYHAATCDDLKDDPTNPLYRKDAENHEYENGECKVCGYPEPVAPHEHEFEEAWTAKGADGHYHKPTCDDLTTANEEYYNGLTAHVDSDNNEVCDDCGYDMHVHTIGIDKDKTGHWDVYTCGHTLEKDVKAHVDEDRDGFCDVCEFNVNAKDYSYTFYMYAPEATSVTISTWVSGNAFAGQIAEGTAMTAVDGHDGWYSYTLNTDTELKAGSGINLNIFVDGTNKGKYSENTTDLYFIPVGNDRGFADFEAAEAKYAELTAPVDPSDQEEVTITINVNTSAVSGNVYIYVYGDAELFEGWPGKQMTLVSGSTYSVTLTAKKTLSGTYNIIINNNSGSQYDLATITVDNGTWSCPDSAVTITKA